ncbi:monooxygenase [Lentzea sp. NBRC 105346]|uniref:FAD-dependent oxidoreductase n=1 Tax=Lentzea sp. NBRC 105346 TaxID=3032205 RepID=UPI0024A23BB5|nr:NAD(P)/FAD-dependent oxidoreductase [Lentzea sp. NBRC 105346]GLZ29257.1 monooxygenase [Lentzea sp. NBRC 105346]
MPDYDVLICGAGAGGLSLAHFLSRQGRRVLVVDKQSRPRDQHKGELLQPRSVQLLSAAGLIEPLTRQGSRTVNRLVCRTAHDAELVDLDFGLLDGPFNYGLLHFYRDFREVLGAELAADYRQGTKVEGLLRSSDGRVTGARLACGTEVSAALTVACDGPRSRLRAGIPSSQRRYGHQLAAFELTGVPELGTDMTMYLTSAGLRLLFGMPGGRARLYVQLPVNRFRDIGRAGLADWITTLLREVPALSKVESPLRANMHSVQVLPAWRASVSAWQVPGMVLLGDAAHTVHPVVGQGMNAAIGDAWSLASILSTVDVLTPGAVDSVAARYEAERRPVMAYVARLSHVLARLFTTTSAVATLVRPHLLRHNRDNAALRRRIVHNMAGFGSDPFTAWAVMSAVRGRSASY